MRNADSLFREPKSDYLWLYHSFQVAAVPKASKIPPLIKIDPEDFKKKIREVNFYCERLTHHRKK
jgi:hypothetical protein